MVTYTNRYAYKRSLRRARRFSVAKWLTITWFSASGGVSGVLIGAIIVNYFCPGHPVYLAIREALKAVFGN